MARILVIDWDSSEVRFLLGTTAGGQLTILKAGGAPIKAEEAVSDESERAESAPEHQDHTEPTADVLDADGNNSEIPSETSAVDSEDEAVASDSEETAAPEKKRSRSVGPDKNSVELGRILKRLLRQNGVFGGRLILCLPRGRAELLNLTLPKLSAAELPEIVQNQVLRDSTTYIEGHPLDFILLGAEDGSEKSQKVLSASITRVELRHLKTICSGAGRKPSRIELRLTALCEFVFAGKISADEPTLLVQEDADEISFVIFDRNRPVYLRAFQIQSNLSEDERRERLKTEILRTLQIGSAGEPITNVILFGAPADYERLIEELTEREIHAAGIDPFALPGIKTGRLTVGEKLGRFAPLVGSLLAERGKNRPVLDLLHPRQKPKPPNYTLYIVPFLLILAATVGYAWRWNRQDLAAKQGDVASLRQQVSQLQVEYESLRPQFTILDNAARWNQFGVNVLDELRDILQRIPSSPDLLVSRLAYNGLDPQFGVPVFIINAKVTNPAVYQRFYRGLTADRSHGVNSRGVQQVAAATSDDRVDYEYSFTAVILCQRRASNDYLKKLPPEIREISADKPEFYDLQMKRQAQENGRQKGATRKNRPNAGRNQAGRDSSNRHQAGRNSAGQNQNGPNSPVPNQVDPNSNGQSPSGANPNPSNPASTPNPSGTNPAPNPNTATNPNPSTPSSPTPPPAENGGGTPPAADNPHNGNGPS